MYLAVTLSETSTTSSCGTVGEGLKEAPVARVGVTVPCVHLLTRCRAPFSCNGSPASEFQCSWVINDQHSASTSFYERLRMHSAFLAA
jgi:hypothetical protein